MPIKTSSTRAEQLCKQPACDSQFAICNLHFAAISVLLVFSCLLLCPYPAVAVEERIFQEGRFEGGQLSYIKDLPVLVVSGTPQEIGRQKAALTGDVVHKLADYPKQLMQIGNNSDEH